MLKQRNTKRWNLTFFGLERAGWANHQDDETPIDPNKSIYVLVNTKGSLTSTCCFFPGFPGVDFLVGRIWEFVIVLSSRIYMHIWIQKYLYMDTSLKCKYTRLVCTAHTSSTHVLPTLLLRVQKMWYWQLLPSRSGWWHGARLLRGFTQDRSDVVRCPHQLIRLGIRTWERWPPAKCSQPLSSATSIKVSPIIQAFRHCQNIAIVLLNIHVLF